jgi:hypothetical protein
VNERHLFVALVWLIAGRIKTAKSKAVGKPMSRRSIAALERARRVFELALCKSGREVKPRSCEKRKLNFFDFFDFAVR